MDISLDLARKIIINRQLIFPQKSADIFKQTESLFNRLGYVQIDTINVVNRAHHHTLWIRNNSYQNHILDQLQSDKKIFEYWGHAASFLPMKDYRFYLPCMKSFLQPRDKWAASILKEHSQLITPVLDRIRSEGPLTTADFKESSSSGQFGWGSWKPAKKVLELLFWQGKLMIKGRRKFQRIYDLTENVLPANINTTMPDRFEVARFLVRRALHAQGIISLKGIQNHINTRDKEALENILQEMVENRDIIEVKIAGINEFYYACEQILLDPPADLPDRVFILSPFDNLIINRKRLNQLFQFDYKLECYYPAEKRKFGYFTLPLLYKDRFIGRMDCKNVRGSKTLQINQLYWEDPSPPGTLLTKIAESMIDFAQFNNCTSILFCTKIKPEIRSYIRSHYEIR